MTGSHEVSGSIPLISTKKRDMLTHVSFFTISALPRRTGNSWKNLLAFFLCSC